MEELEIKGKKYISAKRASSLTGYARDYVGQLAREKKVEASRVGRSWYVLEEDILRHAGVTNDTHTGITKEIKMSVNPTTPTITLEALRRKASPLHLWGNIQYLEDEFETIPQVKIALKKNTEHTEHTVSLARKDTSSRKRERTRSIVKAKRVHFDGVALLGKEEIFSVPSQKGEEKKKSEMARDYVVKMNYTMLFLPLSLAGVFILSGFLFSPFVFHQEWVYADNTLNNQSSVFYADFSPLLDFFSYIFNAGIQSFLWFFDTIISSFEFFILNGINAVVDFLGL